MKRYTRNLLMGTALALTMALPSMVLADKTRDEFTSELSAPFTPGPSPFRNIVEGAPILEGYAEDGCWANCKQKTTRRTQQAIQFAHYALGKAGEALNWAEGYYPTAKAIAEQFLILGKFSAALTGDKKLIERLEYAEDKFEELDGLAHQALAMGRGGQAVLDAMVNLADGIRIPELQGGVQSLLPYMTAAISNWDTDSILRWTDGGLVFNVNNDHALSSSVRIGALNALHMLGRPAAPDEAFKPADHVKANAWLTAFMAHDLSGQGVSRGDKEVLRRTFSTFDDFGVVKLVEEGGQAKIHIYDVKTIDVDGTQPVVEINLPYFYQWKPAIVGDGATTRHNTTPVAEEEADDTVVVAEEDAPPVTNPPASERVVVAADDVAEEDVGTTEV